MYNLHLTVLTLYILQRSNFNYSLKLIPTNFLSGNFIQAIFKKHLN